MELTHRVFKTTEFVAFVVFFLAATAFLFVACLVKEMCSVELFLAWGGLVMGSLVNLGLVRTLQKKFVVDAGSKRIEASAGNAQG